VKLLATLLDANKILGAKFRELSKRVSDKLLTQIKSRHDQLNQEIIAIPRITTLSNIFVRSWEAKIVNTPYTSPMKERELRDYISSLPKKN